MNPIENVNNNIVGIMNSGGRGLYIGDIDDTECQSSYNDLVNSVGKRSSQTKKQSMIQCEIQT